MSDRNLTLLNHFIACVVGLCAGVGLFCVTGLFLLLTTQ